jgi:hypothetical protein
MLQPMTARTIKCKGCGTRREIAAGTCLAGACAVCDEVGWLEARPRRSGGAGRLRRVLRGCRGATSPGLRRTAAGPDDRGALVGA